MKYGLLLMLLILNAAFGYIQSIQNENIDDDIDFMSSNASNDSSSSNEEDILPNQQPIQIGFVNQPELYTATEFAYSIVVILPFHEFNFFVYVMQTQRMLFLLDKEQSIPPLERIPKNYCNVIIPCANTNHIRNFTLLLSHSPWSYYVYPHSNVFFTDFWYWVFHRYYQQVNEYRDQMIYEYQEQTQKLLLEKHPSATQNKSNI